jgi:uncharacterized protein YndB with AHSA1/START domain
VSAKVEARTTHLFKASAERVFDAWLDPAKVRSWMARPVSGMRAFDVRRVEIDARVGGRFTFSDMREHGETLHWGTYLEIDRPRRLVFTWFTSEEDERENASVVTLTIEPQTDGCRATIVHSMDARWAEWGKRTEGGWSTMLRKIEAELDMSAMGTKA